MLTSVENAADGRTFLKLPIQGHMVKPARGSRLLDMVVTAMQNAKASETEAALSDPGEPIYREEGATQIGRTGELRSIAQVGSGVKRGRTGVMILVAEDNEVNQIVLEQILGEVGHSYAIVDNGRLAVERYRELSPDLILMDVSMPEMNGLVATQAIRELEAETGVRVPIVGLTAHALKGDREMCLNAGMDNYVPKPISENMLRATIARHLGEWEAASEAS
jgi:CheY-like chemotaxis protein